MIKKQMKKMAAAAVLGMMLTGGAVMAEAVETQTVTKVGSNATVQANPNNFTGTAWATNLFGAHPPVKTYAANIT